MSSSQVVIAFSTQVDLVFYMVFLSVQNDCNPLLSAVCPKVSLFNTSMIEVWPVASFALSDSQQT
jgi:hypothetical protein